MTATMWGIVSVISLSAALFLWYSLAKMAHAQEEEAEREWQELQDEQAYRRLTDDL